MRKGGWRRARQVRPGDVVADSGGEEHLITGVDQNADTGEVILLAGKDWEQLCLIADPEQEVEVRSPIEVAEPDLVDCQRFATVQGSVFDRQCRLTLEHVGFQITRRRFKVPELGIEVDAEVKGLGGPIWCEFKGSWVGSRPGARRTDTAKKAIANAFLARFDEAPWPPMVLITSHLPPAGSGGAKMLEVAMQAGALLDVVELYAPKADKHLRSLARRQV